MRFRLVFLGHRPERGSGAAEEPLLWRGDGTDVYKRQVLSVIGLGVNDLLMWLGSSVLGVSYLIVKIVATAIVMVYNFVTVSYTHLLHTRIPGRS